MTLKVVLADDHELIRHGLAAVLDTIEGVDLVAECADHPQLMSAVADHRPDVVITDIRMPPTGTDEGIAAALAIREDHPDTGVIVLSQFAEAEYVLELFVDGSQGLGYLLKDKVSRAELERAVLEVSSGGSAVDAAIVEVLVSGRRQQSPIDLLTPREQEVLGLIAEGRNNASVAAELVLSAKAVSKHINSIFSKLHLGEEPEVHRRVRAVLAWLSQ